MAYARQMGRQEEEEEHLMLVDLDYKKIILFLKTSKSECTPGGASALVAKFG